MSSPRELIERFRRTFFEDEDESFPNRVSIEPEEPREEHRNSAVSNRDELPLNPDPFEKRI